MLLSLLTAVTSTCHEDDNISAKQAGDWGVVARLSAFHFQGWFTRQVSCYTLLSGFRLPWPPARLCSCSRLDASKQLTTCTLYHHSPSISHRVLRYGLTDLPPQPNFLPDIPALTESVSVPTTFGKQPIHVAPVTETDLSAALRTMQLGQCCTHLAVVAPFHATEFSNPFDRVLVSTGSCPISASSQSVYSCPCWASALPNSLPKRPDFLRQVNHRTA